MHRDTFCFFYCKYRKTFAKDNHKTIKFEKNEKLL